MKNIFTAQKTVLALAVAGLMSGSVFAAETDAISNITIGENGALVITGNAHNAGAAASASATGNVTTGTQTPTNEGTIGKGTLSNPLTTLTMNGGSLTVKAVAETETTAEQHGELFITDLKLGTYTNTITVDATGADSTIVAKNGLVTSNGNVVLNFLGQPAEGSTSTAKIRTDDNKGITLGGDDALTTINVAAGTTARIQAGTDKGTDGFGAINLENIKLANEGKLTFKGNTISLASAYQNTGAGTTVFDGATTVSKDFTSTTVGLVGADTAGYADIFTNGVTVTDGNFTAQKIDILNGKTMTVAEGNDAEVNVVADTITIGGEKALANSKFEVSAGDVNANFVISDNGSLSTTGGSITADTITVTKSTAKDATGGTLALGGKFDIGTLNVEAVASGQTAGSTGNGVIGTLTVANSQTFTLSGGSLELGTLKLAAETSTDAGDNGNFTMSGQDTVLTTSGANLVKYDPEAQTDKLTKVEGVAVSAGEIVLTDTDYQYSISDRTNLTKAIAGEQNASNVNLVMKYGTLVAKDDDGKVTGNEAYANAVQMGYAGRSEVDWVYGQANASSSATIAENATIGTINFKPSDTFKDKLTQVTIGSSSGNTLTIRGDGNKGELFKGSATEALFILDNVNFGEAGEGDNGVVSQDVTIASNSTVNGDFTFNGELKIGNAEASSQNPAVTLTANKGAVLTINKLAANVPTATPPATTFKQGTLGTAGGTVIVNGAKEGVFTMSAGVNVAGVKDGEQGFGGLVVLGDHYAAAKAYQDAHSLDNTLWIGQATKLDQDVTIAVAQTGEWHGVDATGTGEQTIAIDVASLAASGYKAGATFDTTDAILSGEGDITFTAGQTHSKLVVANLQNISHDILVQNSETGLWQMKLGKDLTTSRVDFGTSFYNENALTNGVVTFEVDEVALHDVRELGFHSVAAVEDSLYNVRFDNGIANTIIFGWDQINEDYDRGLYEVASKSGLLKEGVTYNDFVNYRPEGEGVQPSYDYADEDWMALFVKDGALKDYLALLDSYDASFVGSLVEAEHTVTNLATMGGAFSVGFDINDQIRNTIDRRSSLANLNVARNATGITPWVDVMGTFNSADGLYGSSGYEADIYGATLGADYTASCGAILGAAISIGQADANSVDASTKVDNDVDFWGVSFYGSHRIGNVNGKFDIGYVSTSNDLSANAGYFGHVKESLDADIFTVGVGAEYLATVGSLNVVPHAGIRWSSLDMDDSKYGADYDKMNLFQMPIGVAFSGTFDMTGWKVAPMLDISVVPTFGDKDAVASYTGGIKDTVRVVDSNPVQMTLGVNATVDAWTLGVNYGLSAGSDERLNNAFNFHARYTF